MRTAYKDFLIRNWQESDGFANAKGERTPASEVIRSVLSEYGLGWEPNGADRDVLQVEECYLATGGEFWVIEHQNQVVGTGAYYPIHRGEKAVEIRKMYLLPRARGESFPRLMWTAFIKNIRAYTSGSTKQGCPQMPVGCCRGFGLGKYLLQQLEEAIA